MKLKFFITISFHVLLLSILAGCGIHKHEVVAFKTLSNMSYKPSEINIYPSFSEIKQPYEVIAKVSSAVLPIASSTAENRTSALIEKTAELGANGIVGIYHARCEGTVGECKGPRTAGIAIHTLNSEKELTTTRPKFIIGILPVINKFDDQEIRSEVQSLIQGEAQYLLNRKGYYVTPCTTPGSKSSLNRLYELNMAEIELNCGREIDYVVLIRITKRETLSAALKASMYLVSNKNVYWENTGTEWFNPLSVLVFPIIAPAMAVAYGSEIYVGGAVHNTLESVPKVKATSK